MGTGGPHVGFHPSTHLGRLGSAGNWQEWGMKTRSRGEDPMADVGFKSGPLLPMIGDGDF